MIIVKLQGGLGNQMFQYAFGRSLSLRHSAPLKLDSSYLRAENQSGRTFRLGAFQIRAEEASAEEIGAYCGTLQKLLDKVRSENRKKRIIERTTIFDKKLLEMNDGYFDGHWNNEKYFIDHKDRLALDFILKNPMGTASESMAQKIRAEKNPTSVHIRRGDYVTIKKIADVHGVLPLSYYEEAMKKMFEKFPDTRFFVSSDDIGWAKENLPRNYPLTFVSSPDIPDYEELIIMSLCKHDVIANSSFSWWGAWLNRNQEKIVIAPKHWFADPNRVIKDLIPSPWMQI